MKIRIATVALKRADALSLVSRSLARHTAGEFAASLADDGQTPRPAAQDRSPERVNVARAEHRIAPGAICAARGLDQYLSRS